MSDIVKGVNSKWGRGTSEYSTIGTEFRNDWWEQRVAKIVLVMDWTGLSILSSSMNRAEQFRVVARTHFTWDVPSSASSASGSYFSAATTTHQISQQQRLINSSWGCIGQSLTMFYSQYYSIEYRVEYVCTRSNGTETIIVDTQISNVNSI